MSNFVPLPDFCFEDAINNVELCIFDATPQHPQLKLCLRREFWQRGQKGGPNRHEDFFALYIIKSGRGVHEIDGTPYGIVRGDVYLLAPGSGHTYRDYQDLIIDAAYFSVDLFESRELDVLRDIGGFWRLLAHGGQSGVDRRLHLLPETHHTIEAVIENLRREYTRTDSASVWMLRTGFVSLLIELARLHGQMAHPAKGTTDETLPPTFGRVMELAQVRRWCESNLDDMPNVSQLAKMMALSPSQFRAVWKRETGMTPALYLRRLRLERARAQLDERRLSMEQIARKAGFCDASHFSRSFRACYGSSPRQYREKKVA